MKVAVSIYLAVATLAADEQYARRFVTEHNSDDMRLPELSDDLWNKLKPPLERWWDRLYPNWEPQPSKTTYRIWTNDNILDARACKLCGENDKWVLENDTADQVFVCDHGPVEFFEAIRQIDSVAARVVLRAEVASVFDG